MKPSLFLLSVAAVMVTTSFAGGVSAASLITSSQIKNGTITGADVHDRSLTGADVKSSSVPPGDLRIHPRLLRWTAAYSADGSSTFVQLPSVQTLPKNVVIRSVALTYTGDVSTCVRHGNPEEPTLNTGFIHVTIDAGGTFASYRSAAHATSTVVSPAHADVGTDLFTGSVARRLTARASCEDILNADASPPPPMPSFSVALTFEVTPVVVTGAAAFH